VSENRFSGCISRNIFHEKLDRMKVVALEIFCWKGLTCIFHEKGVLYVEHLRRLDVAFSCSWLAFIGSKALSFNHFNVMKPRLLMVVVEE